MNYYDLISKELQILTISDFIQQRYNSLNDTQKYITLLNDKSITEESNIEHNLFQKLDKAIQHYSEELLNSPIQSLYNVFCYQNCNFTLHSLFYYLIQAHFEKNNNKKKEISVTEDGISICIDIFVK